MKSIDVSRSTGTGHVFLRWWPPLLRTGIWSKYALACSPLVRTVHPCVFNLGAVQLNSSLLTISVIAVLLPGAFHMALQGQPQSDEQSTNYDILKTSHGVRQLVFVAKKVGLMLLHRLPLFSFSVGQQRDFSAVNSSLYPVYACYLVFQLFSHKALYDDDHEDVQQTKGYQGENPFRLHRRRNHMNITDNKTVSSTHDGQAATTSPLSRPEAAIPDVEPGNYSTTSVEIQAPEQPQMSVRVCLSLLVVVTVVRACCDSDAKLRIFALAGRCHCRVPC